MAKRKKRVRKRKQQEKPDEGNTTGRLQEGDSENLRREGAEGHTRPNGRKHNFPLLSGINVVSAGRALESECLRSRCGLWDVSSLTRDQTLAACSGSPQLSPLARQGSPFSLL